MEKGKILLSHGSGGTIMHNLIKRLLLPKLSNPILKELADSALINYKEKIAFTTDSFVVNPLFFPGADIGKLAVCGTVNDLVMVGARPEYLSLALIIEEGMDYGLLEKVIDSISKCAKNTGVKIVTGDLKVVERGACDKLFINTSGVGRLVVKQKLSLKMISPEDKIIITGDIGRHGLAVLTKRKELDLGFNIKSDCAALAPLIIPLLRTQAINFMRDPTRGGLATTLNEIASGSNLCLVISEKEIPVSSKVRVASELLGIDPLYIANEGVAVIIAKNFQAKKLLVLLRKHPLGKNAKIVGSVEKKPSSKVILRTVSGSERTIDMLNADPLPRIC